VPIWNSVAPSNEIATFEPVVASAAGPAPLNKLSTADSQSLDVSAEAIAGIEANAAPTPNPTASNPSRVKARVLFIDLPFPQETPIGVLIAVGASPRCVRVAYAQPLILFEQSLIILEKVLSSCLAH
jgi:hypothetical protein